MKNIDVVALLNQKNAASKKASRAQAKAASKVEDAVQIEQEMTTEESGSVAEVQAQETVLDSFKETKVGQVADAVWQKAVENKAEIALVAAGITVVAVVAGIVRHKRRIKILKSFNEDK